MSEPHKGPGAADAGHEDYERRDVQFGPVWAFGAVLVAAIAVVSLAMVLMFNYFAARYGRQLPHPAPPPVHEPHQEVRQLRAQEEKILSAYERIPDEEGVVRIPIERAMELVLEEGLFTETEPAAPNESP